MLISHIYVWGCFVNFLVIFRYIWREIVFLKGLVKLMEIGNFEVHTLQTVALQPGCHCGVGQLSGGVPKPFFSLSTSL